MLIQILNKIVNCKIPLTIILGIFTIPSIFGQLNESFSDGNLNNNPTWFGEVNEFEVNDDFQLQTSAPEAGTSFLYTEVDFVDSTRWHIYFKMKFSPSDNNNVSIYLAMDGTDPLTSNGYRLRAGENLSDDAIIFERLDSGIPSVLGFGQLGGVATSPAEAECIIEKTSDDLWTFSFGYKGGFPLFEFDLTEDADMSIFTHFGIECKYTSSNTANFFFDDLIIEPLLPDVTPPSLASAILKNPTTLSLTFSEAVDEASLSSTANYIISPGNLSPNNIVYDQALPGQVDLIFDAPFESGILYTIEVDGVADNALNEMPKESADFVLVSRPTIGDLKVSEILFNPAVDGEDFIELYNASSKFLTLDSLRVRNALGDKIEILETDYIIYPGEYVAISEDIDFLQDEYNPIADAKFLTHDLPGFNIDEGNFSIATLVEDRYVTIDSFDYNEDLHFILIDEVKGVSLERLSFEIEGTNLTNWASASQSVHFATPGYKNSNQLVLATADEQVFLADDIFSPNGDGQGDQLVVQFELDKVGYLLNAAIFNDRGFRIKDMATNRLLATSDIITWDGLDGDNQKMPIGIYILYADVFHPDGDVFTKKIPFVLANFLD